MTHRRFALFFSFALLILPLQLQSQSMEAASSATLATQPRPKIGLVLSGGGARGWAHLGVLRWFEENRIPVDYVAGTSMGALVGAMYAMGASPEEIRKIGNELDWSKALSGPPSFDESSFRRKEDQREFPGDLELGAGKRLTLPSGINPGHNISLIFDEMTLPYATLRNFDDLPIPFRCVATDMLEARPVVFKSGPLAKALRATMSIPGVFTPVEIDGKVLADGGILNNIPTDVAKEMGADVIIAVNVGTPLGTREDIADLAGMLSQFIGVATIQSDRRHLLLADVVITPDLGKYTLADFKAVNPISDLGYTAASQMGTTLGRFALSEADWQTHLAARQTKRRTAIPTPVLLEVEGTDARNSRGISERLKTELEKPVNPKTLNSELSGIRGVGRYESLDYTLSSRNDQQRLIIHVRDKSYGPALFIPVVRLRTGELSEVKFSIGGRFTMFDVGSHGAELRIDGLLGSENLLGVEYYKPLGEKGEKGFFLAPRAHLATKSVDLFQDGDRVAEYLQQKIAAALDAGYIFNRKTRLRVGYEIGRETARVSIGDPLLPTVEGLVSSARTQFVYEGRDSATVPTRGASLYAEGRWFFAAPGSEDAFPQAELAASAFKPLSEKGSLFTYGSGGTTFSKLAAPLQQFTLGGPLRLGAFGSDEFRGDHYVLLSGGYLHRVGYLPPFLGRSIYGAGWYETGSAFFKGSNADFRHSVSGALIMETRLGPFVAGGAFGSDTRGKLFISLGRVF
jgi:NTE family protein